MSGGDRRALYSKTTQHPVSRCGDGGGGSIRPDDLVRKAINQCEADCLSILSLSIIAEYARTKVNRRIAAVWPNE